DEPRAPVRSRSRARHAPGHPCRCRRAVRARRAEDGAARSRPHAPAAPALRHRPERRAVSHKLNPRAQAEVYGPTGGDRVRRGDTGLVAEVESDFAVYGDECKFGGGKVLRDRMGQFAGASDAEALDVVITNALVIDWTGIYKADIGIKG